MAEFVFERALGFHVNRAAFGFRQALRARMRAAGHDVAPEEWALLNRLWQEDGLVLGDLAARTIKDKTTISRIVDALERKRLLVRRVDPEDRRRVRAHLTARGRRLESALIPLALDVHAVATREIPSRDLETTARVLARLFQNLTPPPDPPRPGPADPRRSPP